MKVDHITCPASRARIREHEPDICLRRRGGVEKYFYHTRCADEPERVVATRGADPWILVYRQVFWDVDGGAA